MTSPARERALGTDDLLRRVLTFTVATPAEAAAAAGVCTAWRAATATARLRVSVCGRVADWGAVARRLPPGAEGLTLLATNVQASHVAAVLSARMSALLLGSCFVLSGRGLVQRLQPCVGRLTTLALADVQSLAWPAGGAGAMPQLVALALTNTALLLGRARRDDANDANGVESPAAASVCELLQGMPRLRYLGLGGVTFLRPAPPGGPRDAPAVNPFAEGIDRRTRRTPEEAAALAEGVVGAPHAARPPSLTSLDVTFLPQPVRAALEAAFPTAAVVDLARPGDGAAVLAGLSECVALPPSVTAQARQDATRADLRHALPWHVPGFPSLLALSSSAQQPFTRLTPLHLLAALTGEAAGPSARAAAPCGIAGGAGWDADARTDGAADATEDARLSEVADEDAPAAGAAAEETCGGLPAAAAGVASAAAVASAAECRTGVRALLGLQSVLPDPACTTALLERKDGRGGTPLLRACEGGDAGVVAALLAAGASLTAKNHRDELPLYVAALKGHAGAVALIATARAAELSAEAPNPAGGGGGGGGGGEDQASATLPANAVPFAAHPGATDVAARGPDGWTALHAAALSGSLPCVRALLEARAGCGGKHAGGGGGGSAAQGAAWPLVDVDARNRYGRTALHVAVHSRRATVVAALLRAGATAGVCDEAGESPLVMARRLLGSKHLRAAVAALGGGPPPGKAAARPRPAPEPTATPFALAAAGALLDVVALLSDAEAGQAQAARACEECVDPACQR